MVESDLIPHVGLVLTMWLGEVIHFMTVVPEQGHQFLMVLVTPAAGHVDSCHGTVGYGIPARRHIVSMGGHA